MPKIILRQDAIKKNLDRYFTGKPCKHGHIAERGIHLGCLECRKLIDKKYRNTEERKIAFKKYLSKYKKTDEGKEIIKKAQEKYRNTDERKITFKKYLSKYKKTDKGKEIIKKAQQKYNLKKISTTEGRLEMGMRRYILNSLNKSKLKKEDKFINLIGCDLNSLKKNIEKQFVTDMSWENWGKASSTKKTWQIDHIVPINYFIKNYDYREPIIQKVCWHYTNLQPMWANENRLKSDKISKQVAEKKIADIKKQIGADKRSDD